MKRTYGVIHTLAAFIFSASFLNALEGPAIISSSMGSAEVAIDAKLIGSLYPLNSTVYIVNIQTGVGTEAMVSSSSSDSSILAVLSKELAEKIGIQGKSGRISILTLPEAEAFRLVNQAGSQKTEDSQVQDTLPPKPSDAMVAKSPDDDWNERPPIAEREYSGAAIPPSASKNEEPSSPPLENGSKGSSTGKADILEVYIPKLDPYLAQENSSFKVNEEPVLEKTLITPETYLPDKSPTLTNENESPNIDEKPGISDMIAGPEINLPAETPGSMKVSEFSRMSEAPKINGTISDEKTPWPYNSSEYDIALVPAEKRPPAEGVTSTIFQETEIAPIPNGSISRLSPDAEIKPLPPSTPVLGTSPRDTTRRDDGLVYLDPALLIPPIGSTSPGTPPPTLSHTFSVPIIANLEKGKYYVQLATFSNSELVEPELSKIGRSYPLTIQNIWYGDKFLYRILLGPINLGESGAILQRFKGIGYKDAFVRQGS